ncbi:Glutamate--cysteine ligase [Lactiplantibacillus plantarum]|nr:Glutamate--cysteine ligase [Lactiplantibacillus plantarum]
MQVAQHILTSLHDPANTLAARWEQQTNDSLERATQLALQLAATPHFNA